MQNRACPYWLVMSIIIVGALALGGCNPQSRLHLMPPPGTPGLIGSAPAIPEISVERRWWRDIIDDPVLQELIEKGVGSNLDIREAYARLKVQYALLGQARSLFFPMVNADYSLSRSRRPGFFGKDLGTDYRYGLSLSYELDLWNKIRSGVRASSSELNATKADLESLKIMISTEIARDYFVLGELLERVDVLERQRRLFVRKKAFLVERYKRGTIQSDALYLVDRQITGIEARIHSLMSDIERTQNALWVLVGQYPRDRHWRPRPLGDQEIPRPPGTGIPVSILLERPDVSAEGYRVRAQDERVAQAISSWFPGLGISLGYGRSRNASSFGIISGVFWNVAFNASWAIFEGGARRARVEQERGMLTASLIRYHRSILKAFEEVMTASFVNEKADERLDSMRESLKHARFLLDLERSRFRQGISTATSVLDQESNYLEALIQYNMALRDCLLARIELVKALGGAWKLR